MGGGMDCVCDGRKKGALRVLMVTNVYYPVIGGISTYVHDLAKAIENDGGWVGILSFPQALSRSPRLLRWFFYLGFIVYATAVAALLRLRRQPLVVHSHSASFCLTAGAAIRFFLGCRAIHTFHSPLERPSRALNVFVTRVDAVVYVAEATRQLYRRLGVPANPEECLIPGGVDTDSYRPPHSRPSDKADIPSILFVGRICQEKGVAEAIQAMSLMGKPARLLIVGVAQNQTQKAYENSLRDIVDSAPGLNDRVEFLGRLSGKPLAEVFRSADIFVVPSLWDEPAPMVVAEAFASGLPVVAFDSGGLKERVRDGIDGLIVPKGDIRGLAAAFDRLADSPAVRGEMGLRARERAENEFSQMAMYEKYRGVYVC